MNRIKPDYYDRFRCIADKCKHTCCAGWEIDIDEETLKLYESMTGSLGKKLKEYIEIEETPHFRLGEQERCPFLTEKNLCEIILSYGEEGLCQICSDHPRFRNELNGKEEIGVGLCCEAAAKLILEQKEPVTWKEEKDQDQDEIPEPIPEDSLDAAIVKTRNRAFEIIQDRSLRIEERAEKLLSEFGVCIPDMTDTEWIDFYLSLERMDEEWTGELVSLKEKQEIRKEKDLSSLETEFEQLLVYLLYRHLPQAEGFSDLKAQIGYAYVNYKLLRKIMLRKGRKQESDSEELICLSRLWSSETEYSEENTDEILNLIWEENELFG